MRNSPHFIVNERIAWNGDGGRRKNKPCLSNLL